MTFPLLKTLSSLFFRPSLLQVGALCCRDTGSGPEVLLIRSLDSNRWIIPKGWPMRGKTLAEAAAIEAYEEAGVTGDISAEPIGSFRYEKRRASGVKQGCKVQVFRLCVVSVASDFPESDLRAKSWFPASTAATKVQEPELQGLILAQCHKRA